MTPHDLVVRGGGAAFRGRWFPCAVGRSGTGEKLSEGDGVTPRGVHRIQSVLWRVDRLPPPAVGSVQSRRIGPTDLWSDDPEDPAYNTLVAKPHGHSSESLRRADPMYDLVAVLDWNRDPVVSGRGSAIFLHVWRRPRHPTEGCIAFARPDLSWILSRWTPRSRVIVR